MFYEEESKERKLVVDVETKYRQRIYAMPLETGQGLTVLVYGKPKASVIVVKFTFN